MSRIRAVVFDMDGVLIDAKDWHYEALNRALGLFGFGISRYDHLVTYDGLPTKRKLEMLSVEKGLPAGLHPFINEMKQQYTTELIHKLCKPAFAHEYALSRLKADGYKVGVASNSIRHTVELMMDKSHLRPHLDTLVSNQDVAKAKPHPDIYLEAARRLGVTPADCLVVEDNENGIRAATAAGCRLMAVHGVTDVYYDAIRAAVARVEGGG